MPARLAALNPLIDGSLMFENASNGGFPPPMGGSMKVDSINEPVTKVQLALLARREGLDLTFSCSICGGELVPHDKGTGHFQHKTNPNDCSVCV